MSFPPLFTHNSRLKRSPTTTVSGPAGTKWAKPVLVLGVLVGVDVAVPVALKVLVGVLLSGGVLVFVGVGVLVRVGVLLGVKVFVGVLVMVGVNVGVGVKPLPHDGNLNEAIRVCQPFELVVGTYSWVYQNVQSSEGSTDIAL